MLTCLLLILKSKENTNYTVYKLKIFILGLIIIIFSELSLRFVENNFINNIIILSMPFVLVIYFYFTFFLKLKFKELKS